MTQQPHSQPEPVPANAAEEAAALRAAAVRSRRAFLGLGLAGLAGIGGWSWLVSRPEDDGIPRPLRRVLEFNHKLLDAQTGNLRLAPEFARSEARPLRVNGKIGLRGEFDPLAWRLQVRGYAPAGPASRQQEFDMAAIKALPRTEMTTEFKCVEGWSVIVTWAGVRLSDFLARYPLATRSGQPLDPRNPPADAAPYVALTTPDGKYYVGLELAAALHPQTLLCYELNGEPLTLEHGGPLRLVTPLKYGIKQIKRIGTMAFVEQRPPDYWAARGYDWHAGH